MQASLVDDICCPVCHHWLKAEATVRNGNEIIEGKLRCVHCNAEYPIEKRIPNLLPQDVEDHKRREMEGWVNLWENKGMYERPSLEDSFKLPYVNAGVWPDVARMFDLAFKEMNLTGRETILDVGAGQGWASRYFAAKGCKVVAMDIVADEYYGLGRAWAIMEHAGVRFEPILGDGERLPFPDGKFDIVFFCGALHHFKNFDRLLKETYRVLKPGGRIIASGEPSISILLKEETAQASLEETHFGIVERRPRSFEYEIHLRRAGFKCVQVYTYETYNAPPRQIYDWINLVRVNLSKVAKPPMNSIVWWTLSLIRLLPPRLAARLALYINGGNLLIVGSK